METNQSFEEIVKERRNNAINTILEKGKTNFNLWEHNKNKVNKKPGCVLPESERKILVKYAEVLRAKGISISTIYSKLIFLTNILTTPSSTLYKKQYKKITEKDLKKYFAKLSATQKPSTVFVYQVHIRNFFYWLKKGNLPTKKSDYPKIVAWITPEIKQSDRKRLPVENFLTPEDVQKMLASCFSKRDEAIIHVLFESGCRSEEILSLKLKDVQFEEKFVSIAIQKGKTGERKVDLITSLPVLQEWWNKRITETNNNLNAPLWICYGNKVGQPLQWDGLYSIVTRTAKRAGIDERKRVNPHSFRHASTTWLVNLGFTEEQLRKRQGWTSGSRTPSLYIHANKDLGNEAYLKSMGVKTTANEFLEKQKNILQPSICPRCKTKNENGSWNCKMCGLPLNQKALIKAKEELSKQDELMLEFVRRLRETPGLLKGMTNMAKKISKDT